MYYQIVYERNKECNIDSQWIWIGNFCLIWKWNLAGLIKIFKQGSRLSCKDSGCYATWTTAEAPFISRPLSMEILVETLYIGTGFSACVSVFTFKYNLSNAPHLFIHQPQTTHYLCNLQCRQIMPLKYPVTWSSFGWRTPELKSLLLTQSHPALSRHWDV